MNDIHVLSFKAVTVPLGPPTEKENKHKYIRASWMLQKPLMVSDMIDCSYRS